jgi:hypothetical protein
MVGRKVFAALWSALLVQTGFASDELAKQAQNPVANMVSVPMENNFYTDVGPSGKNMFTAVFKPVYPMQITPELNLINRLVAPIMYLEGQDAPDFPAGFDPGDIDIDLGGQEVSPNTSSEFGLGNLQYQAFFSPAKPGKVIWGFGPVLELPTNTDSSLGTDTWSAGPAVLLLAMPGNWVVGLLAQNLWDFASESDEPDINKALFQPIINYNFDKGWYVSATTSITTNWEADSGEEWTVPVGGGGGRLVRFGTQPVDFKLMAYWHAEKPEFGADWYAQFTVKFLFPKG